MPNKIHGIKTPPIQPLAEKPGIDATQRTPYSQQPIEVQSSADKVTLTDSAKLLQRLEETAAQLPATDQRRIDSIRQLIQDGNYRVDPERIVEKLVQFERDLGKGV